MGETYIESECFISTSPLFCGLFALTECIVKRLKEMSSNWSASQDQWIPDQTDDFSFDAVGVFCFISVPYVDTFFISLTLRSWSLPPNISGSFVFVYYSLVLFSSPTSPLQQHHPCSSLCLLSTSCVLSPSSLSCLLSNVHVFLTSLKTLSPLSCGSWTLRGDSPPKTGVPVPLLVTWR